MTDGRMDAQVDVQMPQTHHELRQFCPPGLDGGSATKMALEKSGPVEGVPRR